MSSPLTRLLRRAADAPAWLVAVAVTVAVLATLVVVGHRHPVADSALEETAAAAPAPRVASQSVREATTLRPAARENVVSRSAVDRRERHLARPRLPLAPSDAGQTVAAAKTSTVNVPGHCLEWSREQAGIPSRYTDAATAWDHATGRRPGDPDPPRGAAVYWTGGSSGYGHVAISVGDGLVRSSDAGGAGQVATIGIRELTREWDLQYAGWADSINGYTIPGVAAA